jgi:hypothetical protein
MLTGYPWWVNASRAASLLLTTSAKRIKAWAKTTTVEAVGVPSVRVVRDDVAIVTGVLGYHTANGKPIDSGNSLMLVMERDAGRWRIIAGQVAKPVK